MTIEARLSRDGARVLCGWRNALTGRYGCDGEIGFVITDGVGVRDIEFQPFYMQERPYNPNTEPMPLSVDPHAKARFERGQAPVPGERHKQAPDGTAVLFWRRWGLPATAPCPGPQCGRLNLVAATILTGSEPSE